MNALALTAPLTLAQSERLVELENVIERSIHTAGEALAEIRDSRLYRIEHATFDDYCRAKWHMSRQHADRQIVAAKIIENVTPIGCHPTECVLRPLAPLPPEQQREAWQAAVEKSDDGKPTARDVEVQVVKLRPSREPAAIRHLKKAWGSVTKVDHAAFIKFAENGEPITDERKGKSWKIHRLLSL